MLVESLALAVQLIFDEAEAWTLVVMV